MATRDSTRDDAGWAVFTGVMILLYAFSNFFRGPRRGKRNDAKKSSSEVRGRSCST